MARTMRGNWRLKIPDTEFLKTARTRFQFADECDTDQRQRERDDLAFANREQWPADIKLARQGQQPVNGMPATPSRPTLVIDNTGEPVRQVTSEASSSDLGIEIVPANDFGDLGIIPDDAEIKLREGLVRKIQRESQARDARMWAFDRAVKCGRGYYQILTRYLPGKTDDQEVYVHRIYNQASVLLDPSHDEPDGSDAKWAFVVVDMLWEDYKAAFKTAADGKDNALTSSLGDSDWEMLGNDYPKWFKDADDSGEKGKKTRSVRVVDYWYTQSETKNLTRLSDGTVVWTEELELLDPEALESIGLTVESSRDVVTERIKWAKIDGCQVLEETDWPGPDMPIIKVLGEEVQPYDSERRSEGIIRPMRDPQMGLNYMISKQVEMVGLTPLTPLIGDPDATEGYPEWDLLNTRVVPMARYRSYDDQGRQLREPHRPNADPNLLPISQSIALFSAQIEKTSRVPAARLGDIDPVTRSGKALDRLTSNSKNSTSNFMQNLVRSVRYEGQIENNLLYPIYGARAGRMVRVLTGKGKPDLMMIHDAPETVIDPKEQALMQKASAVAKLTEDATFNVNIKITRDFDTREEEEHAMLGEIFGANPETFNWYADIWFKTGHGPGAEEMAQRAKVMLPPPIQQLIAAQEKGEQPPSPREMQLQAQLAQTQQHLQQATQMIQTDQVKTQAKAAGDMQRTQVEEHFETLRNRENNETKLAVAELGAKVDRLSLFLEERARLGVQISDSAGAEAQRQHEQQMMAGDQTHEVGMAHAQASVDAAQADQDRQLQSAQLAQQNQNGDGAA